MIMVSWVKPAPRRAEREWVDFVRYANLIVPMTLLTPLLTIAFGTWLTGDAIGWPLIIGGTMALAGVAIIVIRPSRTIFKWQLMRPKL
jgi:O-acetylserine/cysteine efflux transporter